MALSPDQQKTMDDINGAKAIVAELGILQGVNAGGEWLPNQARKVGLSNEDVLDNLALGGRNLYPNEKDAQMAGELIADELTKSLKKAGQTITNKRSGKTTVLKAEKLAFGGLTAGLKAALAYLADKMYQRLKSKSTSDGGAAKPVTEKYAAARHAKHGVANSVNLIYTASLDLANALIKGKTKIVISGANIKRLLSNLKN
jgi:hypothetical protein